MITDFVQPGAHYQDLTVMPSHVALAFHPTSLAYFMPMLSGKLISFFTKLARGTENTTILVNVKLFSLYPIVGIIDCRAVLVLPKTMIYCQLRSVS